MSLMFNFEVHTPYRLFYSGKAQVIILDLADGQIGVYANHSPFTALSVTCLLRIREESGEWRNAFVSNGILEVKEKKNVLMVEAAEWPEEIDRERALNSKQQAEKELKETNFKFETDKIKAKLRRAECRLRILET